MSEAIAVPAPTTPTSPTGTKKFDGEGLPFKAKLIGMEDLPVDRDEKACLESMFKLKAVAKARGEHKQRIQMNLTMRSVKVTDETTKTLIGNHEIEQISFVVLDPRDTRAFGYIYNTSDDRHQFWAIKTERSAAISVLALKELFELAFEMYTKSDQKAEPPAVVAPPSPTTTPAELPVPIPEVVPEVPAPVEVPLISPPAPAPVPVPVPVPAPVPTPVTAPVPAPVLTPVPTPVPTPILNLLDGLDEPFNTATIVNVPATVPKKDSTFSLLDDFSGLSFDPPAPVQPAPSVDPWGDFINTPASMNNPALSIFTNPTPINSAVPQPSLFAPPPLTVTPIAAPVVNSSMSPISPIAPPVVSNPLLDLDFFGPTTTKVTKDQFFPQQQKPTIAQLQTDRRA